MFLLVLKNLDSVHYKNMQKTVLFVPTKDNLQCKYVSFNYWILLHLHTFKHLAEATYKSEKKIR